MFNWSHADIIAFIAHFLLGSLSGSASSGLVFMIARRFISDIGRLIRLTVLAGVIVAVVVFILSKHWIQI